MQFCFSPFFLHHTRYTQRIGYYSLTLTDEQDIPNALARLRVIYPNLMQLLYDNVRTRSTGELAPAAKPQPPLALLEQFYAQQNGQSMNKQQRQLSRRLLRQIFEEETQ